MLEAELSGVSLENFTISSPPEICHHSSVAECLTLLCVQLCFTVAKPGHPLWMICSAYSVQTELWFAGSAGWGLKEISSALRTRRLRWDCHVARYSGSIHEVTGVMVPGSRGSGRLRKTWTECVKRDILECGLSDTDPLDRAVWRAGVNANWLPLWQWMKQQYKIKRIFKKKSLLWLEPVQFSQPWVSLCMSSALLKTEDNENNDRDGVIKTVLWRKTIQYMNHYNSFFLY